VNETVPAGQEVMPLSDGDAALLHDLRWHWGESYRICSDGDTWTASPHDEPLIVLTSDDPDELRAMIRTDYSARPSAQRQPRDHTLSSCWCGTAHPSC
jgi:hypothetical protein